MKIVAIADVRVRDVQQAELLRGEAYELVNMTEENVMVVNNQGRKVVYTKKLFAFETVELPLMLGIPDGALSRYGRSHRATGTNLTMWAIPGLRTLQILCHGDAKAAGWYTDLETGQPKNLNVGERIALIHSELSEAFEAYRKDQMDDHLPNRKGLEVELADALIRIMDFAGAENLDIAGAVAEKLEYNRNRADHKLENRRKEGGKKY